MPLIYRGMIRDGDHPQIGPTAKTLGARVPGDIAEHEGMVSPRTGGMSVAPTWRELPMHRVPNRLKDLEPKAAGKNEYECWKMGQGPFEMGMVAEGLTLRPNKPGHGLVEPSEIMTADEFQGLLASTRDRWQIDEETRR